MVYVAIHDLELICMPIRSLYRAYAHARGLKVHPKYRSVMSDQSWTYKCKSILCGKFTNI